MSDNKYKCRICGQEVKQLHYSHLRKHNLKNQEDYFKLYPEDEEYYKHMRHHVTKENSPNTIEFYLKRGHSEEDSKKRLQEHQTKLPFSNKESRPNTIEYWKNKGYSEEESIELMKKTQSRSLERYQKKYGELEGKDKYEQFCKNLGKRKKTEIKNISEKFDVSEKYAEVLFIEKRRSVSPRRNEYWVMKGYNLTDSELLVSQWQSLISPRTIDYWINEGYNEQDALLKQSEWQRKLNGVVYTQEQLKEKEQYYKLVKTYTEFNYKKYYHKINPDNLPRGNEYHLDHKYSIYYGFVNDIPPEIIGSKHNLTILTKEENMIKRESCSIEIEELQNLFEGQ